MAASASNTVTSLDVSSPNLPADAPVAQAARAARWQAKLLRPTRGRWLQAFTVAGWEYNTLEFQIEQLDPRLHGVRLLHITDTHLRRSWPTGLDALVERVKRTPPDLILYGGDQAHRMHHLAPSLPHIERLVKELPSRCGAYGVVGNHDGDLLAPKMSAWGVKMIGEERVEVPVNGGTIELIGFPGPDRLDMDDTVFRDLPHRQHGIPRIIVSHFPDLIRHAIRMTPDLFIAGHTHGGQICLPGGIPIISHDSLPRKYARGVHAYGDICLLVNRGLGFSDFLGADFLQMRAFCPAEVVEIVLTRDT